MRHLTIKDHLFESQLFLGRTVAAVALVVVMIAVLVSRLIYLQIISHEHYITRSEDNRVKVVPLPPTRGLIYDRNGVLLAENLPAYSLEVIPEQAGDIEETIAKLRKVVEIRDADLERFRKQFHQKRRFEGIPLRFRLSDEEVARFAINRHRFPGVDIVARLARHYPLGETLVHAVGYVGRISERDLAGLDERAYSGTTHIGKIGVEKSYEKALHGEVAFQPVEINAQGRTLRALERAAPVPGDDLYLTVDASLQKAAADALGDYRGSIVAIDPNNGDVLAFVSNPGYDPNLFVNGIEPRAYNVLRKSKSRPLFNRALRGQYPPGSTLKPFVGLAGLEYGVLTASHKVFCPGYFSLPGDERRYRDWKRSGHGPVDLEMALAQSCDVYFYELALHLGIERIHSYLAQFGFGERSGIDIGGETTGLLPSKEWKRRARKLPWFPGETLITGIGQGFTLTSPLQLAAATGVLGTYGKRFQPRIVRALRHAGQGAPQSLQPKELAPVPISDREHWDDVISGMVHVVHGPRGTARRVGAGAKYRFAGKTGTAQVFGLGEEEEYEADKIAAHLRDHSLFIAFGPVETPRIAVAVIAENGGSGSHVAAPIARKVLDHYLVKE
ncbi:penicillin-binding protein 2 [Endothiovibrio diazotrophicus]